EGGRAGPRGDGDIVHERSGQLDEVVTRVADRNLDIAPRELGEVDLPPLPAVALPARRPPLPGRAFRRARPVPVVRLVVREERVQLMPEGAREPRAPARVAVQVAKRRPVVLAHCAGFDEDEVPSGLGITR